MWDWIALLLSLAFLGTTLWLGTVFIKLGSMEKILGATCFLVAAISLYMAIRTGMHLYRQYSASPRIITQNPLENRNAVTARAVAGAARLRERLNAANTRAVANGNAAAAQVRVNMPNGIPQIAIRA